MTAYYNEYDPFAAAWLQQLIRAGQIAPGVVDTRSIEDVTPNDLAGFTQCHFFAGIGVWSYALRNAGWSDDRPVWTGSCPCQPFSAAGKGGGFDDERHLWPAFFHLIQQCNPAIVLGEQVASKDGLAWLDLVRADVEGTGRAFAAADLCAAGVGAPHIRQRSFWVAYADHAERRADGSRGNDGDRADPGRSQGAGDAQGRGGTVGLDHAASARHVGALGGAEGLAWDETRLRVPSTGCEENGLASYGYAGPWKSYADWFGVCWHPTCRDSDRNYCDCNDRGAPEGWIWDADDGWLAHADSGQSEQPARERPGPSETVGGGSHGQSDGRGQLVEGQPATSPTNGFWRDADWLYCRDGKWRPVEPGTFPLAHGAANRVGRLRGYGNAIVAPVAQTFIEAVMACN